MTTGVLVGGNAADDSGGGLYLDGPAQFWHTTLAYNVTGPDGDGSGIYVTDGGLPISVAFTNTILVQHSVGISVTGSNTLTLNSVLWQTTPVTLSQSPAATVLVQNQQTGDPVCVSPANGDYHIQVTSAALDRGVNSGVITDIDGDARPNGGGFDLGADEYRPPVTFVYSPLVRR